MKTYYWFVIALLMAGVMESAHADVRLPHLFSNHMLLQRELPIAVWGWAEPGEEITVKFAGQTATVTTDAAGQWQVRLQALPAGGPYDLTVAGKNTVTFTDVIMGDVWICAGQSNMEWLLGFGQGGSDTNVHATTARDIAAATNTMIRWLTDAGPASRDPLTDIPTNNSWVVCTPRTVEGASAVGYFFGKRITAETGVPIGLINCAWGGSAIEPWTPPVGLRAVPELAGMLQEYEARLASYNSDLGKYVDVAATWVETARAARRSGTLIPDLPTPPVNPVKVIHSQGLSLSVIYNARVAPLTRYGIKGVLWYQGESNGSEGDIYYHKMRALIGSWRAAWNQGEFPFYYVQLANWQQPSENPAGGDGWAALRMAQLKALQIPHTGMALAIDVGDAKDIHPRNKEDVGNRLALWALKNEYGQKDLVCSGPLYQGMTIEDDKVRIRFDSVGRGLMIGKKQGHGPAKDDLEGKLQRFAIAGEDKHWVWADAVIDGATVVVSSSVVLRPVAVRYAYSMNPDGCNLYNQDGLPASPFRTDSW